MQPLRRSRSYFVAEALTNAAKHAHATRVTVRTFVAGGTLRVTSTPGAGTSLRAAIPV